jgi:hypothetical protein
MGLPAIGMQGVQTGAMGQATRDQQGRDRMREYAARLAGARDSVEVLARFAQAREERGAGAALEVEFAATSVEPDGASLPAAVWVALRQGDLDAVIETLVQHATEQFLITEHEQLDASYRIATVAECRGLPDIDRLIAQFAAFVQIPSDVVAIVSGWGPDDPRSAAEIERLMDQRYPPPDPQATSPVAAPHDAPVEPDAAARAVSNRSTLAMSSSELTALLSLTPEQQAMLTTLVRQADIVVTAEARTSEP